MKTSSSQFVMMVTFMEQHGDLSKPTTNARGRITTIKNWDELSLLLNSDGIGDTKTTEKWKKVWSDLKNNTKKKAARLHKAASGTGGGPAVFAKLTDLEQSSQPHWCASGYGLGSRRGWFATGNSHSVQSHRCKHRARSHSTSICRMQVALVGYQHIIIKLMSLCS